MALVFLSSRGFRVSDAGAATDTERDYITSSSDLIGTEAKATDESATP